MHLGSRF